MKNNLENDQDEDDGIVMPKKQSSPKLPKAKASPDSPSKVSPVMQIMRAASKAAQAPGKKKKSPIPSGPSKANLKKPQKSGRVDKSDGPSAEDDGEA